jgi:rare lipoprotein A
VTRRTAALLALPSDGVARVRLEVLPDQSQAAVDALPGAPSLQIAAAPRGDVTQTDLPPPGSAASMRTAPVAAAPTRAAAAEAPPLRLPESVTQVAPDPGQLFVELSSFQNYQYAAMQRARVARLGANLVSRYENGGQLFRIMIGPFTTVRQADSVLDQVLAAGVTDARIVVE